MTALAGLKITTARKPTNQPIIIQQRNKLAKRLFEQMELAKAQQSGGTFASRKLKSIKGPDGHPNSPTYGHSKSPTP